ncbi:alpha-1,2-mannosidase, putative [Micrococcales bacterium KH10]|nr:alpha-1,2-mannosidase, putative [Micrococcales bacterium KH10]
MKTSKPSAFIALVLVGVLAVSGSTATAANNPANPVLPAGDQTSATTNPADFVYPFMGTQADHGQNIPGAFAPAGLVKATPVTYPVRAHGGYDYAQSQITGFVHTNTDGAGGNGAAGDFLVVPTMVDYNYRPQASSYAKSFTHDDETAEPGYYQVGLRATQGSDSNVAPAPGVIDAQLAALQRTGIDKYTFPGAGPASLVIDLNHSFSRRVLSSVKVDSLVDGRTSLSGELVASHGGAYRLYFYAETSLPTTNVRTWDDSGTLTGATSQRGWDTGAIMDFDLPAADPTVSLAVTFSGISVAQAQRDQRAELAAIGASGATADSPLDNTALDTVRRATRQTWSDLLDRVRVTATEASDPTGELRGLFYTTLYRMHGAPVDVTSTDGTYRGGDGVIYPADGRVHYGSWSTWDDFRKYAVFSVLYPERYADMIQSKVDMFAQATNAGLTDPRGLTHSAPNVRWERSAVVIADALAKGFTLARLDEAYPALTAYSSAYRDLDSLDEYVAGHAGVTVEAAYDDWAMAAIAEAIGETADAAAYRQRARNYANVIKPAAWTADDGTEVGVLTPRDSGGSWASVNLERFEGNNPYQGSLWQYHWYPTHDLDGLFTAMGGTTAAQLALSHVFGERAPDDCTRMLRNSTNEVDLHLPYLFNYVGQASKTQKWVREIYTAESCNRYVATTENISGSHNNGEFLEPRKMRVYQLSPTGLLPTMDDDHGTMSAMFVTAALGLFPVTQGTDQFQIGTPFFDQIEVTRTSGEVLTIRADGVSPADYYIQSAELNGTALRDTWVTYQSLVGAGSLNFTMGSSASTWGQDSAPAYSMSDESTRISATSPQPGPPIGPATTAELRTSINEALAATEPATQGPYTAASFERLTRARTAATAGVADSNTVRSRLIYLDAQLKAAADGLVLNDGIVRRFEAEASDHWSGGALSRETNASSGNLGGTENGSWIRFDLDQPVTGDALPAGIQIRYANPVERAYHNASVEIRAGTQAGPVVGTVTLPPTGTEWRHYRITSANLTAPQALIGAQQITFVFRGSTPTDRRWVSNVDWLQLTAASPTVRVSLTAGNVDAHGTATDGTALNLGNSYKIQNIKDGSWVHYRALSAAGLSAIGADRVQVTYEKPSSRTPEHTWVEIHRGAPDSTDFDTIPLRETAAGWGTSATVQVALDPARYATDQDIYLVFRSAGHDDARPFVANIESVRFDSAPDLTDLLVARAEAQQALNEVDHRLPSYVAALREAVAVVNDLIERGTGPHSTATQGEIDAAISRLQRATEHVRSLEWTAPDNGGNPPDPGDGGGIPPGGVAPAATVTLTATAAPRRYRVRATVVISATAATSVRPTGTVIVSSGSRRLGAARLVLGRANVTLPRNLEVGRHRLAVSYTPDPAVTTWRSASTATTLRVKKARPKVRVTKVTGLRQGRKAIIRVRVNKVGAYTPKRGKVRVLVAGRGVGVAKVTKRKKRWIAVITTQRLKKTGKVKVKFFGKSKLANATVKTKWRVRR